MAGQVKRLSLLLFSRDDIEQALGLIKDMYDVVDDIVLLDSSNNKNRKMLEDARKSMEKLRIFYVVAMGYPDPMFMYSVNQCRSDWVIMLGMDERLSDRFKDDIRGITEKARCSAFAVKRYEEVSNGKKTQNFTWQIRLFRKGNITFRGLLHEQPSVDGKLEQLRGDDLYISHVQELRKPGTDIQYNRMQKYDRYSYRLYNEKVLDYVSKLRMSSVQDASKTMLGRFLMTFLVFYERVTFKNMDSEVSNFDYFTLQYARNLTYQAKARSITGIFMALPATMKYIKMMREWRSEPDAKENFEIARRINDIGVTEFLGLTNQKTVDRINGRYKDDKQGVTLMFMLLKDRYHELLNN